MKIHVRFMLLSVAMMLFGFSARAGSITEEQARDKAYSFLQSRHAASGGGHFAPAVLPSSLHSTPTGAPALYVFNVDEQNGFVIVAADDRARSILGYATSGSFDVEQAPAALREMMAIYTRQLEVLGQASATPTSKAQRPHRISGTMADVSPLLTTTWDQGDPYNAYCPTLEDQTALTGCVATAMAQIANFHKYPTTQVPSLEAYISDTNRLNVTAWGATTFDWNNMLDSYYGQYTNAQKTAVATLMRYCGQAAKMDYGFSSGAYNGDALYALQQKLGYSTDASFKSAAAYGADGWEDLIYREVSQGRPVYYSALNGDGSNGEISGHAFVVDGYQADGNYFHVNWGWGGAFNGYFNLFALDPGAPESAPTETGWHYQMLAIIGLSPESESEPSLVQDASGSYLITSADDWNELANNLYAYNGGSFKLTADISVTTMVGTEGRPFSGTFDGQGHTLNLNIVTDLERTGPFHYTRDCTFKNLIIDGTFTTSNHGAGGLIGWAQNVTIQNCESRVTINSEYEGDGTCAGFICLVRGGGPAYFYDCVFTGSIHGSNVAWCGGLCGWQDAGAYFSNCLNLGTYDLASNEGCATFCRNGAEVINCYYNSSIGEYDRYNQGTPVSAEQLADGSITRALQDGSRDWTTGQVWGQRVGTDALPLLTSDPDKGIFKVSFVVDGQVMKTVFTNSPIGDKMPTGEDFGLTDATFTANGAAFTSTTTFTSDVTVNVTGTSAYTLTLGTPANGTISINSNACLPGLLKKVTTIPASGYVVSAVTVTDASGNALPVTPVSNNANEFVFTFPKSSVTVSAEFEAGEAEAVRFINGGLTLPSAWRSGNQPWTADTWTIWGDAYDGTDNVIVGTPPADALGHQWYEEGYMLTNSADDVLPNGNQIVWENHAAPFRDGGNYDYFRATGAGGDRTGDFYLRRVFTFNTESVPTKLYMSCSYDDSPVEYYINGTLVYQDHATQSWHDGNYEIELTPAQIALIHTDGTPNVLAAHASQNWGGYHLDCGLYDPTAFIYEVTGEQTVRLMANAFITGDVVIPETVTANGLTYTVTEMEDAATNDCPYLTSMSLPSTITSLGTWVFVNCNSLQWVKSYIPVYQIYQEKVLVAAPLAATEFELDEDCARIWNNAFKFTEQLTTLTLPRSLTYIGYNAFVGCTALTEIYSYARPVPQTEWNVFESIDKSAITVHVYESALASYKQSWGEEFQYVTTPDPQPITLTIDVTDRGSLRSLIEAAAEEKSSTMFDVTGITVTGNLNQDDLRTLAAMCTGVYALATIDLSGAVIEGNYFEYGIFSNKEKLTSITLPETLEYINEYAFYNCQGLTAIHIPASVKRIRSYAFDNCPNLTTVTGCEGLTDTNAWEDRYVFGWAPNVEGDVYGGTTFLSLNKNATGEYEVPAGIKVIVGGAMHGRNITSVVLPASVTDLGNDVFRGCRQLTDFYVYATTPPVCHNGSMEYDYDKGQATLHVPASALEDYQNAEEWREFGNILPLYSGDEVVVKNGILMYVPATTAGEFTVPEGVTGIADNAFSDCSLITKLIIGSVVTLTDHSLKGLADDVEIAACQDIYFDQTLYAIGNTTTDYTIPQECILIHPYAFKNSAALESLKVQSFTVIEPLETSLIGLSTSAAIYVYEPMLDDYKQIWGADYNYQTMPIPEPEAKQIVFTSSDGMWTEADGVWTSQNHDDSSSAEITATLSVSAGETVAFNWSVSSEGGYDCLRGYWNNDLIFEESGSNSGTLYYSFNKSETGTLKFVYSKDGSVSSGDDCATISIATPETVQASGYTVLLINENASIIGTTYTGDITLPESFRILGKTYRVTEFAKTLFSNSKLFTSVTLPSGITTIPENAFYRCENLKSITLGENVTTIGAYAFANSGLTSITIPDGVTELGHRGLQSCASLKSITVGNGVAVIPDCWAEFCNNLQEVTLGKRVKEIRWRAFPGFNLQHVYSYAKSAPSWDDSFYDGINSEAVLHVYENCVSRYQKANGWKDFPSILGDLGTYPTFEIAVNVAEVGTFSEALQTAMAAAGCEDMTDITKLTVTGNVNNDDLYYLRDNVGATLDALDLGAVTVEGGSLDHEQLARCGFEEIILPATLERLNGWYVLEGCTNLKTVNIPSSVKYICPAILNGATSLETVTGGEGVTEMDEWNGMYFDNCPNLQSPVILGNFFFRLPMSTTGAYEVPENVISIARDAMWNVSGLTALTLSENVTAIFGNAFANDNNLKDIYYRAIDMPTTSDEAFNDFNQSACTLHVYEEMVEVFKNNELWSGFNIVGDQGEMPNLTPMNEADYADLCALFSALGGDGWRNKWMTNKNVQTVSRWRGVTFDEEGYVTAIDLSNNGLSGDVSSLTFSGMTRLKNINLSSNALTGDIQPLAASLPQGCKLNVERQDLGYIGEHTLYELCNYGALPSIAYWRTDAGTLASTLIGVGGVCQFYHEGTDGGHYWDCYIYADGGTWNNFKFYWPSPATLECFYPQHFTFTYRYEMGDANMDDALNVLDLQTTLNYSNGRERGLFNFYAADTYGQDDDINVQDIVATVNILLEQEGDDNAGARATAPAEGEACVSVENGAIVLYTTTPVAALDLHLTGIAPEALSWNTEAMGFATATTAQADGTHAIIYSMQPREIGEGATVLATFDASLTPSLTAAVLSDSQARRISVGSTTTTGVLQLRGTVARHWSLTNLSGTTLVSGSQATEADILRQAKSLRLQGVFILDTDGARRKIVIK